ncbi:hypothetical protein NDU88_003219 [Pleurodeles waltl]|uniref:Uncharacterized protein n=1 Tax=Pleurodeles waltl TaxID=8319 RepID=A0AAV7WSH3_PLEWA|nr:hypothetical protein NDU88_003219 [Pleurodeles waltl]
MPACLDCSRAEAGVAGVHLRAAESPDCHARGGECNRWAGLLPDLDCVVGPHGWGVLVALAHLVLGPDMTIKETALMYGGPMWERSSEQQWHPDLGSRSQAG